MAEDGGASVSTDCVCAKCVAACENRPGWFKPGEVEKVADYLGIPLPQLFKDALAVDWWEADEDFPETFVLAPAMTGEEAGSEYPGDPHGACVFLVEGRCSIHPVKPFECRSYHHDDRQAAMDERRQSVVKEWVEHQQQIRELLGREPVAATYFGGGLLGLLSRWSD